LQVGDQFLNALPYPALVALVLITETFAPNRHLARAMGFDFSPAIDGLRNLVFLGCFPYKSESRRRLVGGVFNARATGPFPSPFGP
jgi:hypothetical protein